MNVFDYFFESNKNLEKNFILGSKESISFNELFKNSLKLASFLRNNIGENNNIILVSPNSIFFVTAYLGILKSGNICIPLNFAIEQVNLDFISNKTRNSIVFISKRHQEKLELNESLLIINEDKLNSIIENQIFSGEFGLFNKNKVAEIIFTSGSTGNPKGVMISHENIISNTDSIIDYLNLTSNDIVGIVLPFFYCYGLSLLHTHLKIGGSIVLNNNFIFLSTVIDDLLKYKCTGFAGVPSHFQILLKKSKTFKNTNFPELRYVTQAGGKLHDVFIEEFVNTFPKIDFYVMYGQTEATARLSYLPPNLVTRKLGSIGKSIPGVSIKVVKSNGNTVKVNETGELIAKGDNIMMGYYKDVEGTKDAIKNGWLYTGDMARVDEEGFIYLVARKKEIIKIGGKRVSPKEIEGVILLVPQVVDCTVTGFYDEILGEAIKAVVVIDKLHNKSDIKDKIIKNCKERLSLYKIPQIIELKSNMDLKSTGKKL